MSEGDVQPPVKEKGPVVAEAHQVDTFREFWQGSDCGEGERERGPTEEES